MAPKSGPVDASTQLSALKHNERQNQGLPKLPANTTITRRPINHGPIASPFAGPKAQKVVYVSRKTPVMSAVKRVKKFLREIEKRAMQSQGVDGVLDRSNNKRAQNDSLHRKLEDVSDKLRNDAEEVLVKASGRAMEQALRIAEWFRSKEDEMITNVEVRTGSVSVIDDIVELDEDSHGSAHGGEGEADKENDEATVLEGGETTLELLQNLETSKSPLRIQLGVNEGQQSAEANKSKEDESIQSKKRRRRRKRKEYDHDDLPEARLRWVKTVEIAITLKA